MTRESLVAVDVQRLNVFVQTDAGEMQILHDVAFSAREGTVVALAGESGSGKSTSMLAMLDLLPGGVRVEGSVDVHDRAVLELTSAELRRFRAQHARVIFQDPWSALHPMQSIGAQIIESARSADPDLSRARAAELSREMLARVGIPDPATRMRSYPHQVSGGQLQRIAIAMALVAKPRVLLCDEPTTALDVTTQEQILQLLRDLKDQLNLTVIIATHDLEVIEGFADELVVMYAGAVAESGPVDQLLHDPQHPYTWALLQADPKKSLRQRRLRPLEGRPPSPAERPAGCSFAPRCSSALAICSDVPARPVALDSRRSSACTRVQMLRGVSEVQNGSARVAHEVPR